MKPPTEWINDYTAKFGAKAIPQGVLLWWMKKALCGRRNAGASFREFSEAVIMLEPNMSFRRGMLEPCLYTAAADMTNILHHVDDGRIIC